MRRLMQMIMASPSMASMLSSEWLTKSSATMDSRLSEPTRASMVCPDPSFKGRF